MSEAGVADQVFLFSSALENPDRFFQGYCFIGSDYVYGPAGAEEYYQATGSVVGAAQDGCYVSVQRVDREYHFDTDHSGNKKLFYFWDSTFWAVSNSLCLLVSHLRQHSVWIVPNMAQLRAMGHGKGPALNQVVSYHTIAMGVHLAPPGAKLRISADGLVMSVGPEPESTGYVDALGEFLSLWIARFQALLLDEAVTLQCDLTGGVDSRSVFSLLKAARDRLPAAKARIRIKSSATGSDETDLLIAREICESYGYDLNPPRAPNPARFTSDESFESWRQLCLGAYHPIYFPSNGPRGNHVSLGGGGGENHRPFYKDGTVDEFIRRRAEYVEEPAMKRRFIDELRSTFALLERLDGRATDPLVLHYRHFRNRFHSGRAPQFGVLLSPLASSSLERVTNVMPAAMHASGAINYEIMHALVPELLSIRFDSPRKQPSEAMIASLADIDLRVRDPGVTYGVPREDGRGRPAAQAESPWTLLRDECETCARIPYVADLWGQRFLAMAGGIAERAAERRRLDHAVEGQPVAAVLASAMFA